MDYERKGVARLWVYDKETKEVLYYPDDELYHYGRKGMKWGQHIFGKVKSGASKAGKAIGKKVSTAARNVRDDYRHKRDRKKYQKDMDAFRKKPLKDLTDAELDERIKRLTKEKQAFDLQKALSSADQKNVSAGRAFANKFLSEAVTPSIISAGRTVMTKLLESKGMDMAGLGKTVDSLADLKKAADKSRYEFEITENNKKKRQNEDWLKNRDEELRRRKQNKDANSNQQDNQKKKKKNS